MIAKSTIRRKNPQTGLYYPHLVPISAIRHFVREVVAQFDPERAILFGSYAEGAPTPDSDVDSLVVMRAKNELDQALKIDEALERGFALDLIVRTPLNLRRRLKWGDLFLIEVVARGKVLYEKADRRVGRKGRGRSGSRAKVGRLRGRVAGPAQLLLRPGRTAGSGSEGVRIGQCGVIQ